MKHFKTIFRIVIGLFLPLAIRSAFANEATTVYLTAKGTDLRLAKTAELAWTAMPQPSEKVEVVFVDRTKTFQSILGIGGVAYRRCGRDFL